MITPVGWSHLHTTFSYRDRVYNKKGSLWRGKIIGWYSSSLTPEGYCVESEKEPGSVKMFPADALAPLGD